MHWLSASTSCMASASSTATRPGAAARTWCDACSLLEADSHSGDHSYTAPQCVQEQIDEQAALSSVQSCKDAWPYICSYAESLQDDPKKLGRLKGDSTSLSAACCG